MPSPIQPKKQGKTKSSEGGDLRWERGGWTKIEKLGVGIIGDFLIK